MASRRPGTEPGNPGFGPAGFPLPSTQEGRKRRFVLSEKALLNPPKD